MGLSLSEYVVTEAGFGADLGAEKFLNIKCQAAGLSPEAVVIVATIRALKYHGGVDLKSLKEPNPEAVKKGLVNLEKHLENIQQFGIQPVVAINEFVGDTVAEIAAVEKGCEAKGVKAVVAKVWAEGGKGAEDLAREVVNSIETGNNKFKPLYDWSSPVEEKISTIATKIYGATNVEYTSTARRDLRRIDKLGLNKLPICMAKTQKSLSDDPKKIGRPTDFTITVREIEIAAGAGFLIPITGDMMRMPGLPSTPSAELIDIDEHGQISGLF